MHKKKPFFITFEGIEGSGKSYQSKKLYKKLKNKKISTILTREPGGTPIAENIRKLILVDYFNKNTKEQFNKYTDTLLYLAARNEHVQNVLIPAIKERKVIICDRFIDSTLAYQVFGKGVNINLVNSVHSQILGKLKPDFTILLTVSISKSLGRLRKRKKKNRYDKFSKDFYIKVQKAFIKIAKQNKKRYLVIDNSKDLKNVEDIILKETLKRLKR